MPAEKPSLRERLHYRLRQATVLGGTALGTYIGYKAGTTLLNPAESSNIVEAGLEYIGQASLTASIGTMGFAAGLWVTDGGLVDTMEGGGPN